MMINSSSKPIQASKTHNLTIFLLILISKNNLTSITLNIPILINISTTNSLISTSMIKISTSMIKISSSIDLISSKSSSVMKKTHLKKTEIGMLRVTIKSVSMTRIQPTRMKNQPRSIRTMQISSLITTKLVFSKLIVTTIFSYPTNSSIIANNLILNRMWKKEKICKNMINYHLQIKSIIRDGRLGGNSIKS